MSLQPYHVAIAKDDDSIDVVDDKWKKLFKLSGHRREIYAVIQLLDGRLASCSHDGTIRIWGISKKSTAIVLKQNHNPIHLIVQLRDGRLITASFERTVSAWDLNTQTCTILKRYDRFIDVLIRLSDDRIAIALNDRTIRIFEPNSDAIEIFIMQDDALYNINALIQLADGRLASLSDFGTVRIWDLKNKSSIQLDTTPFPTREMTDLTPPTREMRAIVQLWDRGQLIVGGPHGGNQIWEITEFIDNSRGTKYNYCQANEFLELPTGVLCVQTGQSGQIKAQHMGYTFFQSNSVVYGTKMCLMFTNRDKEQFRKNILDILDPYLIRDLHSIVCNFIQS